MAERDTERDTKILAMASQPNVRLLDIANRYGFSRERARQILARGDIKLPRSKVMVSGIQVSSPKTIAMLSLTETQVRLFMRAEGFPNRDYSRQCLTLLFESLSTEEKRFLLRCMKLEVEAGLWELAELGDKWPPNSQCCY